jgi:ribosomal protein S18 acetylase RimI-like enzyme
MWSIEKLSDSPTRLAAVRELICEYVLLPDAWTHRDGPPASLPTFFESEIAALPFPAQPPMGDIAMAVDERQVFGTGLPVPFEKTVAELKRLYVKTDMRGYGVGRAIVVSLIEVAKEFGYQSVILDVMPSRTYAVDLYRSIGFASARPFRHYDAHEMLFFELLL